MPPTKAELEAHRERYHAIISQARTALADGLYSKAVDLASSSWQYVDGMMQYERRYEDEEFDSIEAIDIVLQFAPLLFKSDRLEELASLLKSQRRIDKNASDDLAAKLADARTRMWDAHRLWDHLERHSLVRQNDLRSALGGDQNHWRGLVESWGRMRIIRRQLVEGSHHLSFVTKLDETSDAKCFSCGALCNGPKRDFLRARSCTNCRQTSAFILLAASNRGATE